MKLQTDHDSDKPVLIVDAQEKQPLPIQGQHICQTLKTGDYTIAGMEHLFCVERKSIADLASCCSKSDRDRFADQLSRMTHFIFPRLLIVGNRQDMLAKNYHAQVTPKQILGTLGAYEIRYRVPVVFEPTPEAAAKRLESWSKYFFNEQTRIHARSTDIEKILSPDRSLHLEHPKLAKVQGD